MLKQKERNNEKVFKATKTLYSLTFRTRGGTKTVGDREMETQA